MRHDWACSDCPATQVRYPSVLNATAPKDRWGYFRALQRLIPAANNMRPGHIAFGSGVSQHHMGGAAVKVRAGLGNCGAAGMPGWRGALAVNWTAA
mgnify:CR=1 FL=1